MRRGQLFAANLRYPLLMLGGLIAGLELLIFGLEDLYGRHVSGLLGFVAGVGLLGYAIWSGRMTVQTFRLQMRQSPYFLVDAQGIECARGRFLWEDILRVAEVIDHDGDSSLRSLIFILQDGTSPRPVERTYLDQFDPQAIAAAKVTSYGLELTINHCRKQAYAALASYGHMPVRVYRYELRTAHATDPARV